MLRSCGRVSEVDRVAMLSDVRALRDELSERIDRITSTLSLRITEEGETTRRHFNIMVEKVEAAVKPVAERLEQIKKLRHG